MIKKLTIITLIIFFAKASFASAATDNVATNNIKRQSVILNVGADFGKYGIYISGHKESEKLADINNQANIGLTYFYNLKPLNNMFSIGGKFMVASYGERFLDEETIDRSATDYRAAEHIYSKASLALKPSYAFFVMGNANVYNIGRFSTNISAGVGLSINTMRFKTEYVDIEYPKYNESTYKTSESYEFAYTVGISETYAISNAWSVGLDLNYTDLGKSSLSLKDDFGTNKIKAKSQNNNFSVGLLVKYSF